MQSIKTLYKIGRGPSSSHTMGPYYAALKVKEMCPKANNFAITLYNSLALTGEGHLTYQVLEQTFAPFKVSFNSKIDVEEHPNTLIIEAYQDKKLLDTVHVESIGGGDIIINGKRIVESEIYPHKNFAEVKEYCIANGLSLYEYVKQIEGDDIDEFLLEV